MYRGPPPLPLNPASCCLVKTLFWGGGGGREGLGVGEGSRGKGPAEWWALAAARSARRRRTWPLRSPPTPPLSDSPPRCLSSVATRRPRRSASRLTAITASSGMPPRRGGRGARGGCGCCCCCCGAPAGGGAGAGAWVGRRIGAPLDAARAARARARARRAAAPPPAAAAGPPRRCRASCMVAGALGFPLAGVAARRRRCARGCERLRSRGGVETSSAERYDGRDVVSNPCRGSPPAYDPRGLSQSSPAPRAQIASSFLFSDTPLHPRTLARAPLQPPPKNPAYLALAPPRPRAGAHDPQGLRVTLPVRPRRPAPPAARSAGAPAARRAPRDAPSRLDWVSGGAVDARARLLVRRPQRDVRAPRRQPGCAAAGAAGGRGARQRARRGGVRGNAPPCGARALQRPANPRAPVPADEFNWCPVPDGGAVRGRGRNSHCSGASGRVAACGPAPRHALFTSTAEPPPPHTHTNPRLPPARTPCCSSASLCSPRLFCTRSSPRSGRCSRAPRSPPSRASSTWVRRPGGRGGGGGGGGGAERKREEE
jgi:hypothetical protein